MGRAERRKASREERQNELLQMKSKAYARNVEQKIKNETRQQDIDFLMTCFALAEHRIHGFGRKRITKTVEYVCSLMDDILEDKATIDDYKRILEEKAKVRLRCNK